MTPTTHSRVDWQRPMLHRHGHTNMKMEMTRQRRTIKNTHDTCLTRVSDTTQLHDTSVSAT